VRYEPALDESLRVIAVCALERGTSPFLPVDWDLIQLIASHLD